GLLGVRNFIAILWTGLLFQLALPFVVVGYTSYVLLVYPPAVVLGVLGFVYLFYVLLAALMYAEYWLLFSPAFTFVTRCWNAIATLNELLRKSHLESAMAPSWVLRRTKY